MGTVQGGWILAGGLACFVCVGATGDVKAAEPDRSFRKSIRTKRPADVHPSPVGYTALQTSPRAWPLITLGSALFGLGYIPAAYLALSGNATSYGPAPQGSTKGTWNFGSPGLLFVPVVGPLMFEGSFCADAREFFKGKNYADEPNDACRGSFLYPLSTLLQLTGLGFVAGGFLVPSRNLPERSVTLNVLPLTGAGRSGMVLFGFF
jgi:hypothetical protein